MPELLSVRALRKAEDGHVRIAAAERVVELKRVVTVEVL
jgi:hypothetical protein